LRSKIITLHNAINSGKIREVEIFIENGVDVHYTDDWATTPLEHAVEVGNIEIVKILLNAGVNGFVGWALPTASMF
jgi:ankyrin repeat protein